MSDDSKPHVGLQHIPRKGEMVPIGKAGSTNIRPQIGRALDDDKVIAKMEPYKLNGGVCGSARLDDFHAMLIVLEHDAANGGVIKSLLDSKTILEAEVHRQVTVEMRSRYVLNKDHKIVGLNPKHYRLIGN